MKFLVKLLRRLVAAARPVDPDTASRDYVDCTGRNREYCLDRLAVGTITVISVCGPCLARIMPAVDMAAGRDLPWPSWLRNRAHTPAPADLRSYRDAGMTP